MSVNNSDGSCDSIELSRRTAGFEGLITLDRSVFPADALTSPTGFAFSFTIEQNAEGFPFVFNVDEDQFYLSLWLRYTQFNIDYFYETTDGSILYRGDLIVPVTDGSLYTRPDPRDIHHWVFSYNPTPRTSFPFGSFDLHRNCSLLHLSLIHI